MKKIVALLILGVSFMFAALNLQTATKEELMGIKGIGDKKAEQILCNRFYLYCMNGKILI